MPLIFFVISIGMPLSEMMEEEVAVAVSGTSKGAAETIPGEGVSNRYRSAREK